MIKILALQGCNRCNSIKTVLKEKGVFYTNEDCTGNSTICDAIERVANTEDYPIVLLMSSSTKIDEIVFLTTEYDRLGKKEIEDGSIMLNGFHSIDKLIESI